MTIGFAVSCLAILALAVVLVSVLVGLAIGVGQRWLKRLAPAAQSRILLAAALAPAFIGVVLLLGWNADLLVFRCRAHGCIYEYAGAWPSAPLLLLLAILTSRVFLAGARAVAGMRRGNALRRDLEDVSSTSTPGLYILPVDEPQAFVLGTWRPRVYISRGLLAVAAGDDLKLILAHEQAHARRRDPLRRLIASIGLALHLPGIASLLERLLARAQEMAADASAARAVGNAPRVAEVLVRLARLQRLQPSLAMGLIGGDLNARVHDLLSNEPRSNRPGAVLLVGAAVAVISLAVAGAHSIHSSAELLLRFLTH